MPSVYLSPSTQDYNEYYDNSGSEEYYMNRITDYIEPYLMASGIAYTRNMPNMTVNEVVKQSNTGNYDLHVALHSNAAGAENAGKQQGSDVYYYLTSKKGKAAAEIFVKNLKEIYLYPDKVRALPNTTFAELKRTNAPSVLLELAYHDNPEDAEWIKENEELIARTVALSICEYLGVPFVNPVPDRQGTVNTPSSRLNIRDMASFSGEIIGKIPNGAVVTITGDEGDWYGVIYDGITGYAYKKYISRN